jgi:ABC-type phosphate transport system auxiliary subunit
VNAALNERLSKLLMENETVKEKVRFLENTVRLLNADLEKYRSKDKKNKKIVSEGRV